MSTRLQLAVWGLGRHALRNVIPAIQQSADVQLAGIHTRNVTFGQAAADEHGCKFWKEEEAMLGDNRIDAVYLATPIGLHHTQGRRILEAGKHLVCEKSLTCGLDHSLGLVQLAATRNLVLCEALMFLFHPRFTALMSFLKEETQSDIRTMVTEFLLPELDVQGYRARADLGGSAFLDVACYPIALALAVGGGDFIATHGRSRIDLETGIDTDGSATLIWPLTGMEAYLSWGYGYAYRNHVSMTGSTMSVEAGKIYTKGGGEKMGFTIYDRRGGLAEVRESPAANSFCAMLSCVALARDDSKLRLSLLSRVRQQAESMARVWECTRQH